MNFTQYLASHHEGRRPGGDQKPWVIAHRGYSAAAPENTLAAVDAARAIGVDLIEIDLGLSGDGTPMVIHDQSIDRTTNLRGQVSLLSDEQLSLADAGAWLGDGFAGQRIPALRRLLEDVEDRGGTILLEFKDDWSPAAIARVSRDITETRMADRVLIQSFSVPTLTACRDVIPMVPRALLRMVPRPDDARLLEDLDAVAYNPSHRGFLTRRSVAEDIMNAGYGMFIWTVDGPQDWERLLGSGIHGIITNHPGRLQGYLAAKYD